MTEVFMDTDVTMDFLTKREPFSLDSMKLFEYASRGKLKIYISSLSINNINYVISRLENVESAKKKIGLLLKLVEILPVGKSTIENSYFSDFRDFEDGLQNFCAVENKIKFIITRNTTDYAKSNLAIFNPKEFLGIFEKTLG